MSSQDSVKRVSTQRSGAVIASIKKALVASARGRARTNGIPFKLTVNDFDVPDTCPILDITLFRCKGMVGGNSPTLDRLVPERGYVRGNVIVISHRANALKRDAPLDEMRKVCTYVDVIEHTVAKYTPVIEDLRARKRKRRRPVAKREVILDITSIEDQEAIPDDAYTISEVCRALGGISKMVLNKEICDGKLAVLKVPEQTLITRAALEAYIATK